MESYTCPQCGELDVDIVVSVRAKARVYMNDEELDVFDISDFEFDNNSSAEHKRCHFVGVVGDFLPENITGEDTKSI